MIFAKPNHIPVFELERLRLLLELLKERKKEFETFAGCLKDKWLRRTVLKLAQDCNQYAHELWAQLETMTGRAQVYEEAKNMRGRTLLSKEDEILHSCLISEKKMIAAYRSIINEPVLEDNLRILLRNHMNGLTCAFMQVRLLSASVKR